MINAVRRLRSSVNFKQRDTLPEMHWLTTQLAVGPAFEDHSLSSVAAAGIDVIVDLREHQTHDATKLERLGVRLLHIPTRDGTMLPVDRLQELAIWIVERFTRGETVLIHCRAGRGRSVAVCYAVLLILGHSLSDAHALVQRTLGVVQLTAAQTAIVLALRDSLDAA